MNEEIEDKVIQDDSLVINKPQSNTVINEEKHLDYF